MKGVMMTKVIKESVVSLTLLMVSGVAAWAAVPAREAGGVAFDNGAPSAASLLEAAKGLAAGQPSIKAAPVPIPAAPAAAPVYHVDVKWQCLGSFALDRLGVQGSAEEEALAKCQAAGAFSCVILDSVIKHGDKTSCDASATAIDAQPIAGAVYQTATKSIKWGRPRFGFGELTTKGVLKSARDAAVDACRSQGLFDCVAVSSILGVCDDDDGCSATGVARGRK